jgi:hypothetical protein
LYTSGGEENKSLEKTPSKKLKAQHRSAAAAAKQEDELWTNPKSGTSEILLADQSQISFIKSNKKI